MTSLFLALFAAWGWFCLVMFQDAPMSAAILLPVVMPLRIGLKTITFVATELDDAIKSACITVVNFERGL